MPNVYCVTPKQMVMSARNLYFRKEIPLTSYLTVLDRFILVCEKEWSEGVLNALELNQAKLFVQRLKEETDAEKNREKLGTM